MSSTQKPFWTELSEDKNSIFYKIVIFFAAFVVLLIFALRLLSESSLLKTSLPGNFQAELEFRLLQRNYYHSPRIVKYYLKNYLQKQDTNDSEKWETIQNFYGYQTGLSDIMKSKANSIELKNIEMKLETIDAALPELKGQEKVLYESFKSKIQYWRPLISTILNPEKLPIIMEKLEVSDDMKQLILMWIWSKKINAIFDPYYPENKLWNTWDISYSKDKNKKSKSLKLNKKVFNTESFKLSNKVPDSFIKAFTALTAFAPSSKKKENEKRLLTLVENSNLSSWIKEEMTYSILYFFRGQNQAEQITNYEQNAILSIVMMALGNLILLLFVIIGLIWGLVYQSRSKQKTAIFITPFAASWTMGIARFALFFLIMLIVEILASSIFIFVIPTTQAYQIFAVFLLKFIFAFLVLFPELLSRFSISLKTYLLKSDFLLVNKLYGKIIKWSIGAYFVAIAAIVFVSLFLALFNLNVSDSVKIQNIEGMLVTTSDYILIFIAVCIFAPFFEELAFRGYLLSAFQQRLSPKSAILLNGVIFGIIHFEPANIVPLSVLGIVLATVRIRSGSLLVPMLVHFLWNLQSFIAILITKI